MLATRTVTEELQSVLCGLVRDDEYCIMADPALSRYASATVQSHNGEMFNYESYIEYCGMDWETTTAEQRYRATTRMPHEDAMRLELDTFLEWVKDNLYVTVEEAKSRRDLDPDDTVTAAQRVIGGSASVNYFVDLLCNVRHHIYDEDEPLSYELYNVFRRRPDTTPVSLLALLGMHRLLCSSEVVDDLVESRVVLSAAEKQRIAAKAVADAEAALRKREKEKARAKRRKLA